MSPRLRSRSLQGSYADLQKLRRGSNASSTVTRVSGEELRFTPVHSTASSESDGLHMRHTRKPSLSDGVPVKRLSTVDPEENFEEVTIKINEEMQKLKEHSD